MVHTTNDSTTNEETTQQQQQKYWFAAGVDPSQTDCICIGTGRFLRSVLVPPLTAATTTSSSGGGSSGYKPILIQPRGTSFLEFMIRQQNSADNNDDDNDCNTYPVDTVLHSGKVETTYVKCSGAFSLGTDQHKQAVKNQLLNKMKRLSVVGLGVTEAGLASSRTQVMQDLYDLFQTVQEHFQNGLWENPSTPNGKICVINMDNVPNNGDIVKKHMMELAQTTNSNDDDKGQNRTMVEFFTKKVVFFNTMVDRITSQRHGLNGEMIPKCEPVPAKALVICDPNGDLPPSFHHLQQKYGVVVRKDPRQMDADIALKLRVANATHTAIAHAMALVQWTNTDALAAAAAATTTSSPTSSDASLTANVFMSYLDAFFYDQIMISSFPGIGSNSPETQGCYDDWRPRLTHPHFGLSTFFITQNGAAKGGIRIGPTVVDLIRSNQPVTVTTAYAFAVLLRWLTPKPGSTLETKKEGIFTGWLAGTSRYAQVTNTTDGHKTTVAYADGLHHNLEQGWYEFRCACKISFDDGSSDKKHPLSEILGDYVSPCQPRTYWAVIRAYLVAPDGGNLAAVANKPAFETLVQAVATLYARMVAGDSLVEILEEMMDKSGAYASHGFATECEALTDAPCLKNGRPLFYQPNPIPTSSHLLKVPVTAENACAVVASEVASTLVIDLHTHLLPPSHGPLCLWGIDELLTYHYLVAEYFITAPSSITPEKFFALNKREQADIIWKALFLDRSPISEACRGVITTLMALGLSEEVTARDLESVRKFYNDYRDRGPAGTEEFSEMVYVKAGVQYAIMTNIPFDSNEAQYWKPQRRGYSERYRSALRVDPLLSGDRATIEKALKSSGYDVTLEGARQYLRDWCDVMEPEYMMASTPHDFVLQESSLAGVKKTGVNEDAMKTPFAFVDQARGNTECVVDCDGGEDEAPTVLNENSDFLSEVLMKVCEERNLPVALKIGAHRGVNPRLKAAGDGVVAFADAGMLGRLCMRFPKVLFLATFLSRNNQHEAAVLASKFRNLHLYGCWWFCNNPSIIEEITKMRIEMLGTGFTAQHSDARVLDQLLYKWPHSRAVIAKVLSNEYSKLKDTGWQPTREEIRRDIERLLGGSYEEFLSKSSPKV